MPWPRPAQRVLIVAAAALFALGLVLGRRDALRLTPVVVPDDPHLDLRLDLNRATSADLETLPGVGVSLAGRIDAYRSTHGPFRSVDELRKVPGLGDTLVAALRPFVTVR